MLHCLRTLWSSCLSVWYVVLLSASTLILLAVFRHDVVCRSMWAYVGHPFRLAFQLDYIFLHTAVTSPSCWIGTKNLFTYYWLTLGRGIWPVDICVPIYALHIGWQPKIWHILHHHLVLKSRILHRLTQIALERVLHMYGMFLNVFFLVLIQNDVCLCRKLEYLKYGDIVWLNISVHNLQLWSVCCVYLAIVMINGLIF